MGTHAAHRVHDNSAAAFDRLDLGKRDALVLHCLLLSSVPLTDREVAERLGFADLNAVRPSISRLIDRALLYEVRSVKCPTTGKTVRTCAPTSLALPEPRQVLLDEVIR